MQPFSARVQDHDVPPEDARETDLGERPQGEVSRVSDARDRNAVDPLVRRLARGHLEAHGPQSMRRAADGVELAHTECPTLRR